MDNSLCPVVTDQPAAEEQPVPGRPAAPIPDQVPPSLSKSAQKKAARTERYASQKLERRAREKETKKEKRRLKAEKRAAGQLDGEDEDEMIRRRKKTKVAPSERFGGKVVVDLGFDDMMNDKEIKSLTSQLAYTYSANRNASYPFSLVYTSLNGRTFTRLEGMSDAGYKRWAHTEWWHEDYDRLWLGLTAAGSTPQEAGGDRVETMPESEARDGRATISVGAQPQPSGGETAPVGDAQKSVIYLTADSEEELTELKAEETYIIGGICDHNRYKVSPALLFTVQGVSLIYLHRFQNLCLNKAKGSGIRTARLPIGRYLASLPTRKVLTVNQVFEILVHWVETKDWEQAFHAVIPKRKYHAGGKGKADLVQSEDRVCNDGDVEQERDDSGSEDGAVIVLREQEQESEADFTR